MEDLLQQLLEYTRRHVFGKHRGTVVDNQDPTARGRIKVEVPAVFGAGQSAWAMPCVPYAGDKVGFYCLPDSGTGVWVEFEAGDPSFPIWSGCFWASGQLPDANDPNIKIWKTNKITIRADDSADELRLANTAGSKTTWATDVKTESGASTHTVGPAGVVSEKGIGKVDVNPGGVIVNNGSLGVV